MASLQKRKLGQEKQRRDDEPPSGNKFNGAKKTEPREPKTSAAPYSHKKEPPPEGMPLITLQSRNYIEDIKSCIITHCRWMDMLKIAKILITGRFDENATVTVDNGKLGPDNDPPGIWPSLGRSSLDCFDQ